MMHRVVARAFIVSLLSVLVSAPAAAQAAAADSGPRLRRWLDVQQVQLSSRFRWFESSEGQVKSSTLQWQPQLRARFLFDAGGRYAVHVGAFSGSVLISGWNNTGGGIGTFAGNFSVKQLFVAAEPVKGLELQAGSLYMNRGEVAENVSYDNDTYVTGERLTWRPAAGRLTQLSVAAGYYGEYREPNFFARADRLGEWNYAQLLAGFRLSPRATASVDYTHEAGRSIVREGLTVRLPESVRALRSLKVEGYQRARRGDGVLLDGGGAGFNVSGDVRVKRLTITAGVMSVDRHYGPYNGDRYEVGTRVYHYGTWALTGDLSVGWFHGEAFATAYPIPNRHRFEIIATLNPTATLKRARVF